MLGTSPDRMLRFGHSSNRQMAARGSSTRCNLPKLFFSSRTDKRENTQVHKSKTRQNIINGGTHMFVKGETEPRGSDDGEVEVHVGSVFLVVGS